MMGSAARRGEASMKRKTPKMMTERRISEMGMEVEAKL
jgi:hypothetical protein